MNAATIDTSELRPASGRFQGFFVNAPGALMNCTCDAYDFPHRTGGGACDECGCEDAPHCEHWIESVDPFGTGDFRYVEFERRKKRELYT